MTLDQLPDHRGVVVRLSLHTLLHLDIQAAHGNLSRRRVAERLRSAVGVVRSEPYRLWSDDHETARVKYVALDWVTDDPYTELDNWLSGGPDNWPMSSLEVYEL